MDYGIVLVSATSMTSDSNGTLYALNATDGVIMWSISAVDVASPQTSGLQYIPAIDDACVQGKLPLLLFALRGAGGVALFLCSTHLLAPFAVVLHLTVVFSFVTGPACVDQSHWSRVPGVWSYGHRLLAGHRRDPGALCRGQDRSFRIQVREALGATGGRVGW